MIMDPHGKPGTGADVVGVEIGLEEVDVLLPMVPSVVELLETSRLEVEVVACETAYTAAARTCSFVLSV